MGRHTLDRAARHRTRGVVGLIAAGLLVACARGEQGRSQADSSAAAGPAAARVPAVDSGAPKLPPRDESDSSFREFRARVLEALARKDTTVLYSILAPDIRTSFGDDNGVAGFRRTWRMDDPRTGVWSALTRVLRMGGRRTSDTSFVAPYVYAFWPDSLDAFSYVAVTDSGAVVRSQPAAGGSVVGTASHSILSFVEWSSMPEAPVPTDTTWAKVRLPNGTEAWLAATDVYSPVGWRAMFAKRNGRWLMIFFVAGD